MKARVYVTMKPSVLDPQGQAIHHALHTLGHHAIAGVRQGKYFEIELADGVTREQAQAELEQISHDVLANTVIEDYRFELVD